MRGRQTPTTPSRISFGVELEFLVAFVIEGEVDPDQSIKDQLQPLLVVPTEDTQVPVFWIHRQIGNALAKAGLPVYNEPEYIAPGSVQENHSQKIVSSFRLVDDCSLEEFKIDGYRFQRVEMNSPAMYDMDLSFDMIRLAVSVLTTNFRCRVNPTCGFHVHVGVGPDERIDARTLRNFAALLWAADPLISRLHPPWRAITRYSQSGRVNDASALGQNQEPGDLIGRRLETSEGGFIRDGWSRIPPLALKKVKYFGRDRMLGESVDPDMRESAMWREIDHDIEDDALLLKGEPWTHHPNIPAIKGTKPAECDPSDPFGPPKINYEPPVPRPRHYGACQDTTEPHASAPPRPRRPPITRRYPRIPGTMRRDTRNDEGFLFPHLAQHGLGGSLEVPVHTPPRRGDVMSAVRDLLGADMTAAQVGEVMRNPRWEKYTNYKFDGYGLTAYREISPVSDGDGDSESRAKAAPSARWRSLNSTTVEFREAAGSLDVEWIAVWARICCRLLQWSRDAAPAEYMAVVRLLAWAQEEGGDYDVVDFLIDLGLLSEARFCEERIHKGEAVWWECLNVLPSDAEEAKAEQAEAKETEAKASAWEEILIRRAEGETALCQSSPKTGGLEVVGRVADVERQHKVGSDPGSGFGSDESADGELAAATVNSWRHSVSQSDEAA